jgi:squalene-associated FAD-dependent desaturase
MGSPSVAIIGGGLAGLSCATILAEHSVTVSLYESRRTWGGRAGTFLDKTTSQSIDHCQHVAMGCCTQFLDFARRHQLDKSLERHREIEFRLVGRPPVVLRGSRILPAPLHLAPFLLANRHLSWVDRISIGKTLLRLAQQSSQENADMRHWLQSQGQSEMSINLFWSPILVSALGDTLENVSVPASRHVLVRGFMSRTDSYEIYVPTAPLDQLYERIAANLRRQAVKLHSSSRVTNITRTNTTRTNTTRTAGDSKWRFEVGEVEKRADAIVSAVASFQLPQVFAADTISSGTELQSAASIEYAPITSIHLWTSRPFLERRQAVLPGGFVDWVFSGDSSGKDRDERSHYYQLVISGSHDLRGRSEESIVMEAVAQLQVHWPTVTRDCIERFRVITQRRSAISMRVGIESKRPLQRSSLPGLYLAGDYTRTGWPSTMEGAVRSGYLAAEALLADLFDTSVSVLRPDPKIGLLAKWLGCG